MDQSTKAARQASANSWGKLALAMDEADLATLSGRYPRTDEELHRAFEYVCQQHYVACTR